MCSKKQPKLLTRSDLNTLKFNKIKIIDLKHSLRENAIRFKANNRKKDLYDLLKENGVFLLHTIGQRGIPTATSPWIRKYIFPGGYIPSLSDIINETQKLNINITDIEILRLHYAHTLTHWYRNVQKNKDKIVKMFEEI